MKQFDFFFFNFGIDFNAYKNEFVLVNKDQFMYVVYLVCVCVYICVYFRQKMGLFFFFFGNWWWGFEHFTFFMESYMKLSLGYIYDHIKIAISFHWKQRRCQFIVSIKTYIKE